MQRGGVKNLMSMPFFDNFDWEALNALSLPPPYVPPPVDLEKIAAKKFTEESFSIAWRAAPNSKPNRPIQQYTICILFIYTR